MNRSIAQLLSQLPESGVVAVFCLSVKDPETDGARGLSPADVATKAVPAVSSPPTMAIGASRSKRRIMITFGTAPRYSVRCTRVRAYAKAVRVFCPPADTSKTILFRAQPRVDGPTVDLHLAPKWRCPSSCGIPENRVQKGLRRGAGAQGED